MPFYYPLAENEDYCTCEWARGNLAKVEKSCKHIRVVKWKNFK